MKQMTKRKKIILGVVCSLLILLVSVGMLVSWEVGRQTGEGLLHCNDGNDTKGNSIKQLEQWGFNLADFQKEWVEEPFTLPSGDGTVIPVGGYYPLAPVGSVILVHGHGGDRVSVAPLAQIYLRNGYTVYAMDQRASGDSDNPLVSFGYYEKQDVEALVEYAKKQAPQLPVIVHGQSMGAATTALYAATDHGKANLDAVVLDSVFESMETMVLGVMEMDGLVGEYFARSADWYLKSTYGFVFADADVTEKAKNIEVPTLVIQCAQDEVAPIEVGKAIFAGINHPDKEYWEADSRHIEAAIDYPEEYEARLMGYLKNVL